MQTIHIAVSLSVFAMATIIYLLTKFLNKCNTDDEEEEEEEVRQVTSIQEKEYTPPPHNLMFDKKTNPILRYVIPVMVVLTMLIFVISNLAKGAIIGLGLTVPSGKMYGPVHFFEFTLIKTLNQLWDLKIYLLFFIIFIFSLIWPYVKLFLMLVAWVVPKSHLKLKQREDLLFWLDALGKLSLVDIFALVVFMVAFKFDIPLSGSHVATYIDPEFGFHCFLYATVLSLIIGHTATFVHRQSIRPKFEGTTTIKASIRTHKFHGRTDDSYMKLSTFFQALLVFFLIIDLVLLSMGIFQKVFVVVIGGLPGVLIGYPGNHKMESVWTFGLGIPLAVTGDPTISVRIIQVVFFFFAVIMPYACVLVVSVMYLVPMSVQAQQRIYSLAEICNAWSAIEVFLLASLVSVLQIPKLVHGIRQKHCLPLEKLLKKFHFQELVGTTKCIDIHTRMESEGAILYVGVGIHILLMHFFIKLSHRALHDRIEREGTFKRKNNSSGLETEKDSQKFFVCFTKTCLGRFLFKDYTPSEEDTPSP